MLSREDNEVLTRIGPDTLMGRLLRRYWMPALLSGELPEPDSAPVRIRLLGEDLIAFRDSGGSVGLVGAHCPHRGASLFFGRNEESGIRCVYHGWKFDVSGQCVDMPNEPAESTFKERVQHTAYPCLDRAGVIWTYMGAPESCPQPPALEWALVPGEQLYVSKRHQETNYAQAIEGGIDSSHVSFLHGDVRARGDHPSARYMRDTTPRFEIVDTEYGFMIGARRNAEPESYYWRITPWLFPWYTMVPPYGDNPIVGHAWVPIDDENCWTFSASWHPTRALSERELEAMRTGRTHHPVKNPGTFTPVRNKSNDYLIDREAQRNGHLFSGIVGISEQDSAMQEGMGPIFDRTTEHLGSSDAAIIQMRRRLVLAARDLERGIEPPRLEPDAYRVRSVSMVLPRSTMSWPEAAREAMRATPDHFFVSV
jgi:phenylpropionate dioxygenase-like ring-hydroxylating dioxygenase large terminal subunit